MAILYYFFWVVEALTSILLIGVILLQRSKSQSMGVALGSPMGEQLFGAQAGNVLTRTTIVLGTIFLLNTVLLAYLGSTSRRSTSLVDRIREPARRSAPAAAPVSPLQGGGEQAAAPIQMPAAPIAPSAPVAIPAPVTVDKTPAGGAAVKP